MSKGRSKLGGVVALVVGLALPHGLPVLADETATGSDVESNADRWGPLALLVGTWEGAIDGKLGTGRGVRRYELLATDRFLVSRHRSVRLPQEKSPEGDEHEEMAVFSLDEDRRTLVLREFMGEGIVIRSTCAIEAKTVVCTSEEVENGPGIRARLTLEITDRYRFTETYAIGWPGRELEHYFTNQWTRSPGADPW